MKEMCLYLLILLMFITSVSSEALESIAHRGFSGKYQENSIQAIRQAWVVNSDIVEVDLRLTFDDIVVLFHDREVEGKEIRSLSYQELQQSTPDYHIPTLNEAINEVLDDKVLLLDIKDEDLRLAELVVNRVLQIPHKQYYFQSANEDVLYYFRANLDNPTVLFVSDLKYDHFGKKPDPRRLSMWLKKNEFSGISAKGRRFIDASYISHFKEAGLLFYIWTINKPDRIDHYSRLDVTGIISDYPNLINRK